MVPSKRVYFLLGLGIVAVPTIAIFVGVTISIAITLVFDAIALGLMVVDGWLVSSHRVQITRQLTSATIDWA